MFGTEYVDPQDLLDTIIDGINYIIIDVNNRLYLEQLVEFFFKCRKYNMAMKTLQCIDSLEPNLIRKIYNQPINIDEIISFDPFINNKERLDILKKELITAINCARDDANTLYWTMISISTIGACFGFACLALLFLSPLPYLFIVGSSAFAIGLITFAIGTIIQYFRQVDYQKDIALMESFQLC